MKKIAIKILAIIMIAVYISAIFFFLAPTTYNATDGGSYGYEAKLYSIHVNKPSKLLYPDAERYISIRIFPFIDLRIPID